MISSKKLQTELLALAFLLFVTMNQCTNRTTFGNTEPLIPGCIVDLQNDLYSFCPMIVFNSEDERIPRVCGFSESTGNWMNYTYLCEAKNNNAIAAFNQPCSCFIIGCINGFKCMNGICMKEDPCKNVNCNSD